MVEMSTPRQIYLAGMENFSILGVVALLVIYGIVLLIRRVARWQKPPICPRCQGCELQRLRSFHSVGHTPTGKRICWVTTFYLCKNCNARLKCTNGEWGDAEAREWSIAVGEVHQPPPP